MPPTLMDPRIVEGLASLDDLRPFPRTVTQLLSSCRNPNTRSYEIADIIEQDAGLASRFIRLANSSLFGFSGRVDSVAHAVVVLGTRTISDVATMLAGADLFADGGDAISEREQLWMHSLECGVIARQLESLVEIATQTKSFLAGIFHDVGKLVLFDLVTIDYCQLNAAAVGIDATALEFETFGTTHEEIGARCAQHWGLSLPLQNAIRFHHSPTKARDDQSLVSLIHDANVLSRHWTLEDEAILSLDLCSRWGLFDSDSPGENNGEKMSEENDRLAEFRLTVNAELAEMTHLCAA